MKKIEIILKVTDACNLRCKYCYNSEKGYENKCLSIERFEKFLKLLAPKYNLIHIIWHGGEPMMAGLKFFKEAMDVEKRLIIGCGAVIENSIQTNGTLINAEWIKFFKENKFKIGISFDGIDNEKYRAQTDKVLKVMDKLKSAGLDFGCVAVVADNDYDLKKNYRFFAQRNIGFDFSQVFTEGAAKDMGALSVKEFTQKYIELFDEWLFDTNGVSIRTFSFFVALSIGCNFRICTNCSCHGKYLSISADGTIYNCGREGLSSYPFGNVDDFESADEIFASPMATALIKGSIARRNKCKENCEYFDICAGGCADIAVMEGGLENIPPNYCYYFKTAYKYISEKVKEVLKNETPLDTLNPSVKRVLAKSLTRLGGTTKNDVTARWIKPCK